MPADAIVSEEWFQRKSLVSTQLGLSQLGGRYSNRFKKPFQGNQYVYYLDFGDCFTGISISENIKLYTLNMRGLLYSIIP